MKRPLSALLAMLIPVCAAAKEAPSTVHPWTPAGVSSDLFESHPAFDPRTGDLYFVRSSKEFKGWRILTSHCDGRQWSTPVDAPFAAPGAEADPWFTPDGRSIYFISTRATGRQNSKDLDIWRADRNADGSWQKPVRLPEFTGSGKRTGF